MQLETVAVDCVYLNWALPAAAAPPLPAPLRYERHAAGGGDYVFVSALLFRLTGLHWRPLAWCRVSYPQMNLRLSVLDGDAVPSVLFVRMLVPFWVVPGARLLARQPARGARFSYPPPAAAPGEGGWCWSVRQRRGFEVAAQPGPPGSGEGPRLGSWEATVEHFRNRPRGYALWGRRLRSIHTLHPPVDVCPLTVDVRDAGLVADAFTDADNDSWQRPHSAWLCPRIPFVFELGKPARLPAVPAERIPAPG